MKQWKAKTSERLKDLARRHLLTRSPSKRTLDFFFGKFPGPFPGSLKLLDIGYGSGLHWSGLDEAFPSNIEVTALDLTAPENRGPARRFIQGRVPECLTDIPDASFDIVVAFDLIEHLEKHDGYRLIYEMERISSKCCAIFTPNGHVWQPPAASNPFQAHISGWTPGELRKIGWRSIFGTTGAKFMYGPLAKPKFLRSGFLGTALRTLLDRVFTLLPSLSFSFIAFQMRGQIAVSSKDLDDWRTG